MLRLKKITTKENQNPQRYTIYTYILLLKIHFIPYKYLELLLLTILLHKTETNLCLEDFTYGISIKNIVVKPHSFFLCF